LSALKEVPAGQLVQTPLPVGAKKPVEQLVQVVDDTAPVLSLKLPAGKFVQKPAPVAELYPTAGQPKQFGKPV
jgi:hypothetical protein